MTGFDIDDKMSNNQGIQTLLEAEKEASKIVAKARSYRVQRLKDARMEAQRDIDALKAEKMAQFKALEAAYDQKQAAGVQGLQQKLADDLKGIQQLYSVQAPQVLDLLIRKVTECNPKPHVNATKPT